MQEQPAAQPVILLFNEGEEFGLNGAGAFIDADPLAPRVGSLINIEARGVSGPAFMFETSEPNGPAIAAFAAATGRPYANSLTADFAKLIPNYTDVVVFKDRGWTTLSYAIVGNETRYHSPGDRVEALSRRSLQHMGSEVLAATRTLPGAAAAASGSMPISRAGSCCRCRCSWPPYCSPRSSAGSGSPAGATRPSAVPCWFPRPWSSPASARPSRSLSSPASFASGDYWRAWPLLSYLAVYATLLGGDVRRARLARPSCSQGQAADRLPGC